MLAFVFGVFFASFFFEDFFIYSKKELIVFLISFFVFGIFAFLSLKKFATKHHFDENSHILMNFLKNIDKKEGKIILFFAFFVLGFGRYYLSLDFFDKNKIYYFNNQNIVFEGFVKTDPIFTNKQKFVLNVKGGKGRKMQGKVLVFSKLYPAYSYGDYLRLQCNLKAPQNFNNFNYQRYLAKSHIYSICYYPKIEKIKNTKFSFLKKVYFFKNKIKKIIDYGLDKKSAGIAKAMILADKSDVDKEIRDNFSKMGISHIIAISGLHIGILFGLLMFVLVWIGFWRRQAFIISSLLVLLYILFIGAPPSAVRAFLMFFIMFFAYAFGRLSSSLKSLLFVAMILLLYNPKLLRDDLGFQLSFLAILGIILFYKKIDNFLKNLKIKNYFNLRNVFAMSISAQILSVPISFWHFRYFSIFSPFFNLLIIPVLPVLLLALFGAIFLSLFLPFFAVFFFYPAHLILDYIIFLSNF